MDRDDGDVGRHDLSADAVGVLTDALVATRPKGVDAALVRAEAPWGFRVDATASTAFAAVTGGACWLRRPAASPVRLETGDLTLMPLTGSGYGLASTPQGPLESYGRIDDMVVKYASDSEFTFSRAFTRAHGQPPGRYRAS